MNDELQAYPEYKDSDIVWLGRVPAHWDLAPNRAIFKIKKETVGSKSSEYDLLSLTLRGVILRDLENMQGKFPASFDTYQVVEPDDFVFCFFDVDETPRTVGLSEQAGMITGAYTVMEATDLVNPHYMYHYYLSLDEYKALKPLYRGLRKTIPKNSFLSAKSPVPPPEEQDAIVHFLDVAEKRIRRYIRAKQKLIKLLSEQKQAIIQQAVTCGLNPDAPMKDSGVEWLGEIPAHWKVLRAKFLFREVNNRSESGQETHLSMSQKHGLVPSDSIDEWRMLSTSYVGAKICEVNDIVLNRLKAHLGVFALAAQKGLVSPDYTVLRPIKNISERYFELTLRTPGCRLELRQRAKGIVEGFWRLYTDDFYDIPLPVPSVEEQHYIVNKLDNNLQVINESISQINREIDIIHEYRTRLIADVVTGKVDVRGLAFEMPDEFEDDDLLDVDEDDLLEEDEFEEVTDAE
jgi:type I restriction enzyme, S subunit